VLLREGFVDRPDGSTITVGKSIAEPFDELFRSHTLEVSVNRPKHGAATVGI
jgi:hypothetical protein